MSLRRAWKVCGWCTRQSGRVLLWSMWLVILLALCAQVYYLSAKRFPVPGPLRDALQRRLAEHGLRFEFKHSSLSLDGRILLEDARLAQLKARSNLVTAQSVYLAVDPWKLLVGDFEWEELRVSGLDLHLPGLHSATGTDELVARNVDFLLRPSGKQIELSHATGYIGRIPVTARGQFIAPSGGRDSADVKASVRQAIAGYLKAAAGTQDAERWMDAVETPRLVVSIRPYSVDVDFSAAAIDLRALPGAHDARLSRLKLSTRVPLAPRPGTPLRVDGAIGAVDFPTTVAARDLTFQLRALFGDSLTDISPRDLELQLGSVRWRAVEAGPVALTVATESFAGPLVADASLQLAGSAWRLRAAGNPRAGRADLVLDGFVDDATLAFAGAQIGKNLAELLDPRDPAPLNVRAEFAPGWKLARATGRLHSGPVRVGDVHLDETGTEFTYDGATVLCDNLVLRQGESLAHGSYSMNTATQDFRFLLTGGLRPMGIAGWFRDWWTNFWGTFDFARGLPVADVDVQGRWGDLTATRVFVAAEGERTGLKSQPFDRVRTRLFLRPHWFDILHFHVSQGDHVAEGRLARALAEDHDAWTHMDFEVDSTLPLETIGKLFKEESAELLAPYAFTTPPRLRLSGRVDSAASLAGKHERIDIDLSSKGPMTFHGFPLADLSFEAALRDEVLDLPVLAVAFADGRAHGKARLTGPEGARRLWFDIRLADANLGAVTRSLANLQPSAGSVPENETVSEAVRQRQQRLDDLRLVLNISAEGNYTDFYSYTGGGRAVITGPELAQLNLLGPLSESLRNSVVNLGSFSLTTADAPFALRGDRLRFENLRVTGPSALIQAEGDYALRGGALDFTAKIHPFEESTSMVGRSVDFVLSPLSKVFEVKLQGTLAKPSWIFSYGPSRLLNTLTGGEKKSPAPSTPPSE